jgi:ubiquinone/menaquinone biosynthesis C-methylase UbiE
MIALPPPQVDPPVSKPPISNWLSELEEKVAREFRRRTGLDYKTTMAQAIEAADPRPGMQVLDVATGTGVIARQLVGLIGDKGRIIGVDKTEEMVEQARLGAQSAGVGRKIEWRVAPAESLPFGDESFDLVTCTMAFHLMQARRFVREAYRVLKAGGRLLIAAELRPNVEVSELRLKVRRNYYQFIARDRMEAEAHFHSPAEVIGMLTATGFRQSTIRGLRTRRSKYARVFSLIKAVK